MIGGVWLTGVLLLMACGAKDSETAVFQAIDLGKEANVSCFEIEPNGSMWIGLDGQGLAYKESATAMPHFYNKLSSTLPSDVVICNYRDSKNRLWFGTFGDGLFYWDEGTFTPLPEDIGGQALRYIGSIMEDANGRLWIGTLNDGLACIDTLGTVTMLNKDNSTLATNYVVELKTFDHRELYVATGWGLFVLNTDSRQIQPLTDHQGKPLLQQQLIRSLYTAHDGMLWIGTQNGLYIYNKENRHYTRLTTDDGLADNFVKAIGSNHKGHYWVTSEHSATQVIPQEDGTYQCIAYRQEAGTGNVTFHVRAIACDINGRMLLGTSKGILTPTPLEPERPVDRPWLIYVLTAICFVAAGVTGGYLWRGYHQKRIAKRAGEGRVYAEITPSTLEITSVDQQLKEKATLLVEEHLDDSDFSVEQLAAELGMSRGHLYKRLLDITGKTPIEFIRIVRIKQGRQLLEQSGEGVQQVAWRVGMSPKQFSKYFKEEYGVLPSEFLKK